MGARGSVSSGCGPWSSGARARARVPCMGSCACGGRAVLLAKTGSSGCAHAGQTRDRRDTRDATRSLLDLFTVTLKPTIPLPEWPRQKLPAPPSPVQEPRIRVPRSALPTLAVGVGCRTPPSPLGVAQTRCWRQAGRRWQVDPALPSRLLMAGHASRVSLALPPGAAFGSEGQPQVAFLHHQPEPPPPGEWSSTAAARWCRTRTVAQPERGGRI